MKSIMSINNKFFEYSPIELYELVKDYNVDGFEIYIDFTNKAELDFLEELIYLCSTCNLHFQVHGERSLSIEDQLEFLKLLEKASDLLGYKINVVMHSIDLSDKETSIEATTNYLNEITDKCNNDKVIISLENLNPYQGVYRLNKNDITPIVANNENIYMTYDIGHEISEYGKITNLDENIIPLISNVHIHTMNKFYSQGFDHKPIYKDDEHWNEILKGITLLKNHKYDGSIVFEYDLYTCRGDSIKEKIISYAESIKYVSERL